MITRSLGLDESMSNMPSPIQQNIEGFGHIDAEKEIANFNER
jgi:hypothetical protein